jgi:hypothetical protein
MIPSMPYKNPNDQRASSRRHYERNTEKMKQRAKDQRIASRDEVSAYLKTLKEQPCTDCQGSWPYYVMHFDHIGNDKEFNISLYRRHGYGLAKVKLEVEKCEVVCANCHAIRTYNRMFPVPLSGFEPESSGL